MIQNISYYPNKSTGMYASKSNVYVQRRVNSPVNFTGNNVMAFGEKNFRKLEFFFRRLVNVIGDKVGQDSFAGLYNDLKGVEPQSEEFIAQLLKATNKYSKKMEFEINIEDGNIERIVNSGKPHIFIMNHDKQLRDPNMLATFGKILYSMYQNAGKSATCPRPKIVLNEDILLSMKPERAELLKKLGAIGIDANVYSTDKGKNARAMLPMLRDFIRGNANIFIFPEGRLAGRKPTLKERFQSGISEMISKLIEKTDEVNVTPLAFAYNKFSKRDLTSMFVGKPITFKRNGDFVTTTKGNIDSEFATLGYKKYFGNALLNEDKIITDSGVPVKSDDASSYISGILCENLEICRKEAKKILPNTSLGDKAELLI